MSDSDIRVFAAPTPKHLPRYDIEELYYYCKRKNVEPKELNKIELKKFELTEENEC